MTTEQQLDEAIDEVIALRDENASLAHDQIILRDELASVQLDALKCLEALSSISNLITPHAVAIKMATPKAYQPLRKGVFDLIATVQQHIAKIGYERIDIED